MPAGLFSPGEPSLVWFLCGAGQSLPVLTDTFTGGHPNLASPSSHSLSSCSILSLVFLTVLSISSPLLPPESPIYVLIPNPECSPGLLSSFEPCELLFLQLFLEALLISVSAGDSAIILQLPGASAVLCCGIYHTLKKLSNL